MTEEKSAVRIVSMKTGEITISGITDEEREKIEGMVNVGLSWMTKAPEGHLRFSPIHEPLPAPIPDEAMLPFWRRCDLRPTGIQMEFFGSEEPLQQHSPSISIRSLCGYHYTPEGYRIEAKKLKSYGFECLRSQRATNGQFFEIWFLPGLWAARGNLQSEINGSNLMRRAAINHAGKLTFEKPSIENSDNKKKLKRAVSFLCRHVSFGSLDVSVQRAAMMIDGE